MTPRRVVKKRHISRPNLTQKHGAGKMKIIPIGGVEEVGRNMTVFEYEDDILIVDMGFQFPEENMPGIDYIIPNVEYLKGREKDIKGVIITHGHLDHIGAIPYLIPKLGRPIIYTAKLTKGLIDRRQEEFRDKLQIEEINAESKLKLGKFNVEFFAVNHNIPDSFGVLLKTPVGNFIHTGDWKFDHSPVGDKPADLGRIAMIGQEGVRVLLSDSTNAEKPGHAISESAIKNNLNQVFDKSPGRIVAATFSSNLNRIYQLIMLAEKHGRRVAIDGRSMKTNVEIAYKLKYLKVNPGTIIPLDQARRMADDKILILATGAQGESRAALMRMANGEHRQINIKKG